MLHLICKKFMCAERCRDVSLDVTLTPPDNVHGTLRWNIVLAKIGYKMCVISIEYHILPLAAEFKLYLWQTWGTYIYYHTLCERRALSNFIVDLVIIWTWVEYYLVIEFLNVSVSCDELRDIDQWYIFDITFNLESRLYF
jgi:hypothetical protein